MRIEAKQKTNKNLIPKGHIIAKEQFKIPFSKPASPVDDSFAKSTLKYKTIENNLYIEGPDFLAVFDIQKGHLNNYVYNEHSMLKKPLHLDFWRMPTSNDIGNKMHERLATWKSINSKQQLTSFKIDTISKQQIKIQTSSKLLEPNANFNLNYTIFSNGEIYVDFKMEITDKIFPEMPRIGLNLTIPAKFENMAWFGRGPHETYWDRKTGADIGLYNGKVIEQYVPYIFPQENGNKTDVRWASFVDAKNNGWLIVGDEPLNIAAYPYEQEQLSAFKNAVEVTFQDIVEVHIDLQQMGVGGDNSWGEHTLEKYKLLNNTYQFGFWLKPVSNKTNTHEKSKVVLKN